MKNLLIYLSFAIVSAIIVCVNRSFITMTGGEATIEGTVLTYGMILYYTIITKK